MNEKVLKLFLSIPAILYIGFYIWLLTTNVFPILQTSITEAAKLTIGQVVLLILTFTLLLFCLVLSILWIGAIWIGGEK